MPNQTPILHLNKLISGQCNQLVLELEDSSFTKFARPCQRNMSFMGVGLPRVGLPICTEKEITYVPPTIVVLHEYITASPIQKHSLVRSRETKYGTQGAIFSSQFAKVIPSSPIVHCDQKHDANHNLGHHHSQSLVKTLIW
jgi:hypothetical protein